MWFGWEMGDSPLMDVKGHWRIRKIALLDEDVPCHIHNHC